jgi:hypothetical protein
VTPSEFVTMAIILYACGIATAVAARTLYRDTKMAQMKEEHDKVVTMQGKEIARLRAHVAKIIGTGADK